MNNIEHKNTTDLLIERADVAHIVEIHSLLKAELEVPDDIDEITLCIKKYPSFVAISENDGIVGVSYTFRIGFDMLMLHGLHVHNLYRNNHIGDKLLDATELEAKELGYRTFVLTNSMQYAGVNKRSAVPFYTQHDYEIKHKSPNILPTHLMIKDV